ncbi:MAG: tRNA-dihydrouridine synthase, partial [Selenomonadaceae bacterium]|nr:tRNA-dihydrouridine synthase [Selenomonadaceae bacterium]
MKLHSIMHRSDMLGCLLCDRAPCDAACPHGISPAGILRSLWFDNEDCAAAGLPKIPCRECPAPCEMSCLSPRDVSIKKIMTRLEEELRPLLDVNPPPDEKALQTDLCGIFLENPFLLSSSAVSRTYDMCARAFEAGWAGAAFKTICTIDIHEASPRFSAIKGSDGSIIGFKNIEQLSDHSLPENMEIFRRLKKNFPRKLILASIMGQNEKEWEELARTCEANGADAVELNFSCPNMMEKGLGSDIGQVPELVERFTAAAKRGTSIPVLAKLTPN